MSLNPATFTDKTNQALAAAEELALESGHPQIVPLHLAATMFADSASLAVAIARRAGASPDKVLSGLRQALSKLPTQSPVPERASPSTALLRMLRAAQQQQKSAKDSYLAIDHLLSAMAKESSLSKVFSAAGLDSNTLREAISATRDTNSPITSKHAEDTYDALNKYCHDLIAEAERNEIDSVIGRDKELRAVIEVLCRRTKNNVVITGEPGIGKSALVNLLATRMVSQDVPQNLMGKLYSLDLGLLMAGASHKGEFEERLQSVVKAVKQAGDVILFIDEIHNIVGMGAGGGSMDAANQLKAELGRGLRVIGATTNQEYEKYLMKDKPFARRFQRIQLNEPSVEDTVSILRGLKDRYESHHGVRITDGAIVMAAKLADRYVPDRFQPDKSIDLIDGACASVRTQLDLQPEIIDNLERRQLQLEIEETALAMEKDKASKARLEAVRHELASIGEQLGPLRAQHAAERKTVDEIQAVQAKIVQVNQKIEAAERRRDRAAVADLRYAAIPELNERLEKLLKLREAEAASDETKLMREIVSETEIAEIVSRWTGIPVTRLTTTQADRLLRLGDALREKVIGQDEAVTAVAEAVMRSRAGLSRRNQPIGSFLFLGPTGVGKTELVKQLAIQLFDDVKNMVRIDMSEYSERHAVARLIGAPPGYVGHEEGGQLTEAIRKKPYSVVLFDEVEKAHPTVLTILLQVLDDGRITDGKGQTVDCSNTVIILTSNIGAEYLLAAADDDDDTKRQRTASSSASSSASRRRDRDAAMEGAQKKVMEDVRRHFRPEFLNRLDDILMFNPLRHDALRNILKLQFKEMTSRLVERDIKVSVTSEALDFILAEAYDPAFGARPLRRYIQKELVTAISKLIISGELVDHSLLEIGYDPRAAAVAGGAGAGAGAGSGSSYSRAGPSPLTYTSTKMDSA